MPILQLSAVTTKGEQVVFQKPVSMEFQSDRFTPADSLECAVLDDAGARQFKQMTALLDSRPLFEGIVDVQERIISPDGCYTRLACRSRPALMLDNEVKPYLYFSLNADQLVRNHALPYGASGHRLPYNASLGRILAAKGMSHWEFICFFCRLAYGKTPYLDRDGRLTLTPGEGTVRLFSNSKPGGTGYHQAKITHDRSRMLSRLYVKTGKNDNGGYYNKIIHNSLAQSLGVQRERYYHPARQWENNLFLSGESLIKEHQLDYLSVELELAGLHQIRVGDPGRFFDQGADYRSLYVSQVVLKASPEGMCTRVVLWDQSVL